MNIAVVYQSRGGLTKKVADAIASGLHTAAWSVEEVKDLECDLLFLGGGVYPTGLDKKLKKFLKTLEPRSAKKVVLFGTSAGGRKPFGMMKALLERKCVFVDDTFFYAPGQFLFLNKGRPNADDLTKAEEWAKAFITR